ncbi:MAG: glycosyltransferase family 4 protein, partial [Bryobacterales bacterium]|nr:glycosyltransferase family 4 protein [Bryobacterales bacterium]
GRTLVEWVIERLRTHCPDTQFALMTPAADECLLRQVCEHLRIPAIAASEAQPLERYRAACQALGADVAAFFRHGLAFGPVGLLAQAFDHHRSRGNNLTTMLGLPLWCSADIYDAELLEQLARHGHFNEPREAIGRMLIEAGLQGEPMPFACGIQPFAAKDFYSLDSARMAGEILIRRPMDANTAREVVRRMNGADPNTVAGWCLWKTVSCEQHTANRKQLARPRPLPAGPATVVYASNSTGFTGAEESLCHLVQHLDRSRYRPVALVPLEGYLADRLRVAGAEVHCFGHSFFENTTEDFLAVAQAVQRCSPHLVHIECMPGLPLSITLPLLGIPSVQHLRIARLGLVADQVRCADAIITVSEYVRSRAIRLNVHAGNVHVVWNGIDLDKFRPGVFDKDEMRREFSIPAETKLILSVGRFVPSKRQDLLVSAFRKLRERVPNSVLVFAGDVGDEAFAQQVRNEVCAAGLNDSVRFIGFQKDIRRIEAAADLMVLCSRREPLARCVLESLAMGIPCVVNESGGMTEIIEHGVNGLVAASDNDAALADKMGELLLQDELSTRLARNGRGFAERRLSAAAYAEKVMWVYDQVLHRNLAVRMAEDKSTTRCIHYE